MRQSENLRLRLRDGETEVRSLHSSDEVHESVWSQGSDKLTLSVSET